MKLKILLALTFLFILAANVRAMNYPEPFIAGDRADVSFLIPSNDVGITGALAAAEIGSNLQYESSKNSNCTSSGCGSPFNFSAHSIYYKDTESGFENKNIISIGILCNNKVSNSMLGLNQDCTNLDEKTGFLQGYLIKVVQSPYNSSKIAMVILATNTTLLSDAVKHIENNKPSTDIGTEIKEIKQEKQISDVQPINEAKPSFFQRIANWFKRLFGFG